jgi:hypothetical protein
MAVVNFIIDSDYRWLLVLAALLGAALVLSWLEGGGERRTADV